MCAHTLLKRSFGSNATSLYHCGATEAQDVRCSLMGNVPYVVTLSRMIYSTIMKQRSSYLTQTIPKNTSTYVRTQAALPSSYRIFSLGMHALATCWAKPTIYRGAAAHARAYCFRSNAASRNRSSTARSIATNATTASIRHRHDISAYTLYGVVPSLYSAHSGEW